MRPGIWGWSELAICDTGMEQVSHKFQCNLLGVPEITRQGQPFILSRRQARALLYYLANELQPVPRDRLIFLLWPDASETTARRNLTRLLSYTRQALPGLDLLLLDKTAVALNPKLVLSDTDQFTGLGRANDPASWETAVYLYRGPFLNGFTLPNSPEFDQWLSQTQRQYERTYLDMLRKLITTKSDNRAPAAAIHYAQKYLTSDDLAEEIHRHLISLYAATGDRSAALRQFEQCAMVLERELGVSPLPETRAAYEAARDGTQLPPPEILPKPEWTTLPGLDLPLVGREEAWQLLTEAYRRYQNGGVIFISGEAGVGKSRLMQEFATVQSGLVLTGNSHATGQALPYQPLVGALRLALPLRGRWSHTLPIWLAEVSRLLPELQTHFPDLPPPVEVAPQQAQARLFEALTEVFASLATDSPLLLCLDDVHWVDEATAGWLEYATKRLAGSNICIVGTHRSHQAGRLANWRRALNRAGLAAPVLLGGLSETTVAELLHKAGIDQTAAHPLAGRIHAATGGNAFFVLETIRELLESGQPFDQLVDLPLPQTVRDAVLRRAARLTPLAQQVVTVAAVLSPHMRVETLVEASGRSELETVESLEELLAHQLLQADGYGFRFQHDLTRKAIYEEISPWRQRLLHRRAAEGLIYSSAPDDAGMAATIAVHFETAGEVTQAINYYRQAATTAQHLHAHQEAITWLRRAITLSRQVVTYPTAMAQLHEALADSLGFAGQYASAEDEYRLTLPLAPYENKLWQAELHRKLAGTFPPRHRYQEAAVIYQTALNTLGDWPLSHQAEWQKTWLDIHLDLLHSLFYQGQTAKMTDLAIRLQPLMEQAGTSRQKIVFYYRLAMKELLEHRQQASPETITNMRETLQYVLETDDPYLISLWQFGLGSCLLWRGNLAEAAPELQTALSIANAIGHAFLQNQCLTCLAVLHRLQGEPVLVRRYLDLHWQILPRLNAPFYLGAVHANQAWLSFKADDLQTAQTEARQAVTLWGQESYPFQWLAHWILLALALRRRAMPQAITSAQAMLDPSQHKLPDNITHLLETAVQAWRSGNSEATHTHLSQALKLAYEYGYL